MTGTDFDVVVCNNLPPQKQIDEVIHSCFAHSD